MHLVIYFIDTGTHRNLTSVKCLIDPKQNRPIELSLKTKIDLIRATESVPKLNQKQLAEKFGIGTSTVSDILKKKEEMSF